MTTLEQQYHGHRIYFKEKTEEWCITLEGKEQCNKSLQAIKNYIDRANKKKFTRVPVYVDKEVSWYKKDEGYDEAEITSVGIDGTIFIVRRGSKHAEHSRICYVRDDKNAKLIIEIARLTKVYQDAKQAKEKAEEELQKVDLEALRKEALGEK